MNKRTMTPEHIAAYGSFLIAEERSSGTVENYLQAARTFLTWADGQPTDSWPLHSASPNISLVFDDPAVVCLTPAVRTPALAGNASLQGSLVAVQLRCISGRSIVGRSIEGWTERRPGAQSAPEQVRKADQEYQNTTGPGRP